VDKTVPASAQRRIAAELSTAFSAVPSLEWLKTGIDRRRPGMEHVALHSPIRTVPMLDSGECGKSILIVERNGNTHVQVHKPASDMYQKTFAWIDAYPKAFQKAKESVALLNSPDLLSQPIDVLRDLFCIVSYHVDMDNPPSDDEVKKLLAEMQRFKFQELCALSFSIKRQSTSSGQMNIPVVAVLITPRDKEDPLNKGVPPDEEDPLDELDEWDSDRPFGFPIEFYNGRWSMGWMP